MSSTTDISKLDDLIVTAIDSIKGYENAAGHAASDALKSFFRDMANDRRAIVSDLQAVSRTLGGTPSDFGSAAGTIHRGFENLRTALGGGDTAIIKEVERGEDYLKEEFERAQHDDGVSAETRVAISRAYESVLRGHDRASRLKHYVEAAA